MSTIILNDYFRKKNGEYVKPFVVLKEQMETLADFVRRVRAEKDLSLEQVRVRSGYNIAKSYISRIENGEVTNVTPEKLKALATGLGVTEEEVFACARGATPTEDPNFKKSRFAKLHFTYEKLSPKKQVAYDRILDLAERELERIRREKEM